MRWVHTGKLHVIPALGKGDGERMERGGIGTPKEKDIPS